MSGPICIKTFPTRPEAELAKGLLEAQGIRAVVAVDDAGGMRPGLAFVLGARVLVDGADAARALEIVSALEGPERAADRSALRARLRGCMVPALLAAVLFGVGAALTGRAGWAGRVLFAMALVLLVTALVRGARAV